MQEIFAMSISVDLLITVVCAKDLLPKDDNGLSDPYVILKVGRTQCRTKVVRKNLNPTFNESFVLFVYAYTQVTPTHKQTQ